MVSGRVGVYEVLAGDSVMFEADFYGFDNNLTTPTSANVSVYNTEGTLANSGAPSVSAVGQLYYIMEANSGGRFTAVWRGYVGGNKKVMKITFSVKEPVYEYLP